MNAFVERFQQQLQKLPANNYVIAYSGGMDSHVLLHLCHQLKLSVRAVYINHGLQKEAEQWSQHCADICQQLNISFKNICVNAKAATGESPEDAARNARYQALMLELKENECLLTAHHKDDQAETLLLQLFRGAGPAGLSSMPSIKHIGKASHARPLLDTSRDELLKYAKEHELNWIEDPSNKNTEFDRNFVRQEVMPLIKQRWRSVDDAISKSVSQQQDALEIIEAMAAIDLASIITQQDNVISIKALKSLSSARQLNVLRYWIRQSNKDLPTSKILHQLISSVVPAADDATPAVSWGQSEIRRYQDELYLLEKKEHDTSETLLWKPREILVIENIGVELVAHATNNNGLSSSLMDQQLKVCFRQGGEKIKPPGRKHSHSLKNLMQDAGIPPWERSRIPLVYLDDELVCVCGHWMASKFAVDGDGWLPVCR